MCRAAPGLKKLDTYLRATIGAQNSAGIVGDDNHISGYHVCAERLKGTDYSMRLARDKAGAKQYPEDSCAIDVGMRWTHSRRWLAGLVLDCRAGEDYTSDIREIIGSLDGKTALYWDRQAGFKAVRYTGAGHIDHTHVSTFRDATQRDQTAILKTFFTPTEEDDDMGYIIPFKIEPGWAFDASGDNRNHPEYLTVVTFDWSNWSAVKALGPARLVLNGGWCHPEGAKVNGRPMDIDEGARLRVEIGIAGDDGETWWPRIGRGGVKKDAVVEFGPHDGLFAEDLPDKTHTIMIGRVPRTENVADDTTGGWWPVSGAVIFDKKPQ